MKNPKIKLKEQQTRIARATHHDDSSCCHCKRPQRSRDHRQKRSPEPPNSPWSDESGSYVQDLCVGAARLTMAMKRAEVRTWHEDQEEKVACPQHDEALRSFISQVRPS
mmetsp:Transcript_3718/g.13334  ORF Transcript_3718/g.13334 Transcript_3718/m.13334 type:complete len:109 (+) Transcript_3718:1868-2194(+)